MANINNINKALDLIEEASEFLTEETNIEDSEEGENILCSLGEVLENLRNFVE